MSGEHLLLTNSVTESRVNHRTQKRKFVRYACMVGQQLTKVHTRYHSMGGLKRPSILRRSMGLRIVRFQMTGTTVKKNNNQRGILIMLGHGSSAAKTQQVTQT